jgi:hypothetical protein
MNDQSIESQIDAYHDGLAQGMVRYAHWKDGEQYVGTTGKTLKLALEEVEFEREQAKIEYYSQRY